MPPFTAIGQRFVLSPVGIFDFQIAPKFRDLKVAPSIMETTTPAYHPEMLLLSILNRLAGAQKIDQGT
jgi:hypothetical protein